MPCYSYQDNDPLLLNNIEFVHTLTNGGLNYSYDSLEWICEFPEADQLVVFKRASALAEEVLLVSTTDYVVNTTLKRIELVSNQFPGELVIRRRTPTNRMLYSFTDGAKLTAKQLNESFNQLLFAIQENTITNSLTSYYYTISTGINAWVSMTPYTVGNIVSYTSGGNTSLYKCILNVTSATNPSADDPHWDVLNPSSSGFIITNGPQAVEFNLTGLAAGQALIWNGNSFALAPSTGVFADLTGVGVTNPQNGDILVYNSGTSDWENRDPRVDITLLNPVFDGRIFLHQAHVQSYVSSGAAITAPSVLTKFKNGSNQWVHTDPATVYHILQECIPPLPNTASTIDPIGFLQSVNDQLESLSANITNPVKVKFHWDLRYDRKVLAQHNDSTSLLDDASVCFWDSPAELYNVLGYSMAAGSPLKWHAVQATAGGNIDRVSPYFSTTLSADHNTIINYSSKINGYGVHRFYLDVPQCHTSALMGLPALTGSGDNTFFVSTSLGGGGLSTIIDQLNEPGGETTPNHRDYYLMGLRDMAFAGARINPSTAATVKDRHATTRVKEGYLLAAEYSGLEDIFYRRLEEDGGSYSSVLWKIPKQIIYYNKAALQYSNETNDQLYTSSSFNRDKVRFTGHSLMRDINNGGESTITAGGRGYYFKADEYWADWCNNWAGDVGAKFKRFNEANIDWIISGVSPSATNVGIYRSSPVSYYTDDQSPLRQSAHYFPWPFRSEDPRSSTSTYTGLTGSLLQHTDINRLFSNSTNYLPDPVDEYVFRLVTKKSLLPYFRDTNFTFLKTAIILEYGFTEHNFNCTNTIRTNNYEIYRHGSILRDRARVLTHLDKSNVKVFVKNETVERTNTSEDRYVITLAIQVPRLKSIGYSRYYRGAYSITQRDAETLDSDVELGPWNFGSWPVADTNLIAPTIGGGVNEIFYNAAGGLQDSFLYPGKDDAQNQNPVFALAGTGSQTAPLGLSGRNECAVKFTRMGIPSNLWIRLSVLNTDGSLGLIDAAGYDLSTGED